MREADTRFVTTYAQVRRQLLFHFSEKLQKLGAIQARGADDLVERALGQVAAVHRDDDPMSVIGMPEDVVAALDPIELPATALQRADRLPPGAA